jgi:hypothetical protein
LRLAPQPAANSSSALAGKSPIYLSTQSPMVSGLSYATNSARNQISPYLVGHKKTGGIEIPPACNPPD